MPSHKLIPGVGSRASAVASEARTDYRRREKATLSATSTRRKVMHACPEVEDAAASPAPAVIAMKKKDKERGRKLTLQLITLRVLNVEERNLPADAVADVLLKKRILRLDSMDLDALDNLEVFCLKELYLQNNHLSKIENLEGQKHLVLLSLSSNCITKVANLLPHLRNLRLLDLSDNVIEHLDTSELPPSLLTLDLRGNPICSHPSYPQLILDDLPGLQRLDGYRVERQNDGKCKLVKEEDVNDVATAGRSVDAVTADEKKKTKKKSNNDYESDDDEHDKVSSSHGTRIKQMAASLKESHRHHLQALEKEMEDLLLLSQSRLSQKIDQVHHRQQEVQVQVDQLLDSARKDCDTRAPTTTASLSAAAAEPRPLSSSFTQLMREKAMKAIAGYKTRVSSPAPEKEEGSKSGGTGSKEIKGAGLVVGQINHHTASTYPKAGRAEGKDRYGDDDDSSDDDGEAMLLHK